MRTLFPPVNTFRGQPSPNEIRYERRRVEMLLRCFGLEKHAAQLWNDSEKHWGPPGRRLGFESFHRVFPTFPWELTAKMFYHMSTFDSSLQSMATFFRDFKRTIVWQWYHKLWLNFLNQDDRSSNPMRPLGMIFPMGNVKGGFIIHDGPAQTTGPRLIYDHLYWDQSGRQVRCHIEPYLSWLRAVSRSGWTPDVPGESVLALRERVEMPTGVNMEPWMVRALGIGPDTLVLAWLYQILTFAPPQFDVPPRIGRYEGHRCVIATQAEIAKKLGLGPRQVRSAFESLRAKGLVGSKPPSIWLNNDRIEDLASR